LKQTQIFNQNPTSTSELSNRELRDVKRRERVPLLYICIELQVRNVVKLLFDCLLPAVQHDSTAFWLPFDCDSS